MKPTRYFSSKQENRVAKIFQEAYRTSNSGATPFDKGDLKDSHSLFECKTTVKPTENMTLPKDWLEKLDQEAFGMGREMAILIFGYDGSDANDQLYAVVKVEDFAEMYNQYFSEE